MDQSFPQGSRKGNDHRTSNSPLRPFHPSLKSSWLLQDSTIDFEKRRNVPIRYNRDLVQTTIKAMKRVAEIKKRREHVFWKKRYIYLDYFPESRLTLIACVVQKDGRSQREGQGPPAEDHYQQRNRLDNTCGTSYRLRFADAGKSQGQVLCPQCPYPRRRSIHGYGNRLAIYSVSCAHCTLLFFVVIQYIHVDWCIKEYRTEGEEMASEDSRNRSPLLVFSLCFVPGIWI